MEPMESAVIFGVLVVAAGAAAVLVLLNRSRTAAPPDSVPSMEVYRQAYAKALQAKEPQAIEKTGDGLLQATRYWQPGSLGSVAESVYRDALSLLKEHPDVKPYALTVGRLAYASRRPDGKLTVYDEQAILNDMTAYS